MADIKAVVVPKELYYHEAAYVRGLETAARATLASLVEMVECYGGDDGLGPIPIIEHAKAAISAAKAAGIKVES
jgi:hypothetical protein